MWHGKKRALHCCAAGFSVFLGGCLMLPVAIAMSPGKAPAPLAASTPATSQKNPQHVCFAAVFEGPLPGKADYCLGLRDWKNGHYRNGLQYLKLAAGWGNKNAQYTLGLIYYAGHHVAADPVRGMAWLKLANERHNDMQISRVARSAFKWATPAQRQRAKQLFEQMRGKYGDKVAAARAWHHLQRWKNGHSGSNSGCVRLSGAQAAAARRLGLAGVSPRSIRFFLRPSHPVSAIEAPKIHRKVSIETAGVCITIHMRHHVTQQLAEKYFRGWRGTVTVGPLKAVPAPATTSGR